MTDLWTHLAADVDGERHERALTAALTACAQHFGFVAEARTATEFDDRVTLVADQIEARVAAATQGDPGLFPVIHQSVLDSWHENWQSVQDQRARESQRRNAPRAAARQAARRSAGFYTPVGPGWDTLIPGQRIRIGFEESAEDGVFVRIDRNSDPDLYGDTPVIVYTDASGREQRYMPTGGESPRMARQASRRQVRRTAGGHPDWSKGWARGVPDTNPDGGPEFWGRRILPDGTEVGLFRGPRNRVRFYDKDGNQYGEEQDNVAPAFAYAETQGWHDPDSVRNHWNPIGASRRTTAVSTYVTAPNGTEYEWGYDVDPDSSSSDGPALTVVLYDDNGNVIDSIGGVEVDFQVSDHGNVNLGPEGEQYLYEVAQDMAIARTSSKRTAVAIPEPDVNRDDYWAWTSPDGWATAFYLADGSRVVIQGRDAADQFQAENPDAELGPSTHNPGRTSSKRTATVQSDAVDAYSRGQRTLQVGDRVGDAVVTSVGPQTVQFAYDDGYTGAIQITFNDNGTMTPAWDTALADQGLTRRDVALASRRQANAFWDTIKDQWNELTTAKSADDVMRILSPARNPYGDSSMASGEGFFAGSGGDDQVYDALRQAGWKVVEAEADYYWCMKAPNGDLITYIEGDVYRGNRMTASAARRTALNWQTLPDSPDYGWYLNPVDFRYGYRANIVQQGGQYVLSIYFADGDDFNPDTLVSSQSYPTLEAAQAAAETFTATASRTAAKGRYVIVDTKDNSLGRHHHDLDRAKKEVRDSEDKWGAPKGRFRIKDRQTKEWVDHRSSKTAGQFTDYHTPLECGCSLANGRCAKHAEMMHALYDAYYSGDRDLVIALYSVADGYGQPGKVPPQGLDWSGIRDSSTEAIEAMYAIVRGRTASRRAQAATNPDLPSALRTVFEATVRMYFRAHGAHWNVRGADFSQYHSLFSDIYGDVYGAIDPLAELLRKLGTDAPSSSVGDDTPGVDPSPASLVADLLTYNDTVLAAIEAAIKLSSDAADQGILNFLADRQDAHLKWRWFLSMSVTSARTARVNRAATVTLAPRQAGVAMGQHDASWGLENRYALGTVESSLDAGQLEFLAGYHDGYEQGQNGLFQDALIHQGSLLVQAEFPPKDDEDKDDDEDDEGDDEGDDEKAPQDGGQAPAPAAPAQPAAPFDPTTMDVGTKARLNYTMTDSGNTGDVEVVFVREENGVYFFNGPTGEFGVAQQNGQWQDGEGNTFTFASPDGSSGDDTPNKAKADPQAQDAAADKAEGEDPNAKQDDPPWAKKSSHRTAGVNSTAEGAAFMDFLYQQASIYVAKFRDLAAEELGKDWDPDEGMGTSDISIELGRMLDSCAKYGPIQGRTTFTPSDLPTVFNWMISNYDLRRTSSKEAFWGKGKPKGDTEESLQRQFVHDLSEDHKSYNQGVKEQEERSKKMHEQLGYGTTDLTPSWSK